MQDKIMVHYTERNVLSSPFSTVSVANFFLRFRRDKHTANRLLLQSSDTPIKHGPRTVGFPSQKTVPSARHMDPFK